MQLSDKLWEMGSLDDIKEKVSPELFQVHIGMNVIGIWKYEGWDSILGEHADFVPYIPQVLQELEMFDIKQAFEDVIALFPEDTVFASDNEAYYDIYNFLTTFSGKTQNEKLQGITPEKRREMVKRMHQNVNQLDEVTEQYWSDEMESIIQNMLR